MKNKEKTELVELKEKIQSGKIALGKEMVLKALKLKKLDKVFLAKNCPKMVKEDLHYYAKLAQVPVVELEQDNEELGVLCKKNFFIATIGTY